MRNQKHFFFLQLKCCICDPCRHKFYHTNKSVCYTMCTIDASSNPIESFWFLFYSQVHMTIEHQKNRKKNKMQRETIIHTNKKREIVKWQIDIIVTSMPFYGCKFSSEIVGKCDLYKCHQNGSFFSFCIIV